MPRALSVVMVPTDPAEGQRKGLCWIGETVVTTRVSIMVGLTLQLECRNEACTIRNLEGFKHELDTGTFAERENRLSKLGKSRLLDPEETGIVSSSSIGEKGANLQIIHMWN